MRRRSYFAFLRAAGGWSLILLALILIHPPPVLAQDDARPGEPSSVQRALDRMRLFGDLRLRHESDFRLEDRPDRDRQRVRFRLGFNLGISEEVLLGARVVTGDADDPKSSHQTLGDGFASFELSLDRAFLTYRPLWADGLWFTGGKFAHPFYSDPIYGELVWDADIQPEGIAAGFSLRNAGALGRIDLTLGEYVLEEQSQASEATAFVAQLALRTRLGKRMSSAWAVGYYHYTDTTPDGSPAILEDNAGNAVVDLDMDGIPDQFLSRFDILHPIVTLAFDTWRFPLTVSGEYIRNMEAPDGVDRGWVAGVSLGRTEKARNWLVYYQRPVIEQEAVFSPVAQDDFLFATNHRSHLLGLRYQAFNNLELHLWGLVSRRNRPPPGPTAGSEQHQWRVRLDINAKF